MARWYVGPNGEGREADFNGDGIIDSADVDKLKACYLKRTDEHPECEIVDLNGDGIVSTIDFSTLAGFMAGRDPRTGVRLEPVPEPRRSLMLPMVIGTAVVGGLLLASRKK